MAAILDFKMAAINSNFFYNFSFEHHMKSKLVINQMVSIGESPKISYLNYLKAINEWPPFQNGRHFCKSNVFNRRESINIILTNLKQLLNGRHLGFQIVPNFQFVS